MIKRSLFLSLLLLTICLVAQCSILRSGRSQRANKLSVDYYLEEDEFAFHTVGRLLEGEEEEGDHPDEHDHDDDHKPWGKVIGFTILVNLATLTGVLFLIPLVTKRGLRAVCWNEAIPEGQAAEGPKSNLINILIPSFAAGALLATAVYLVIPEAIHLIMKALDEDDHDEHDEEEDHEGHDHLLRRWMEGEEEGHDDHAGEIAPAAIWRFGSSLLAGFLLPIVFSAILPRKHFDGDEDQQEREEAPLQDPENLAQDPKVDDETKTKTAIINRTPIDYGLASSILLGDALHNFCDGIFVGVALSQCDLATAYTIIGITLYHEVAQELADYFLLTKHAGLSPIIALALNFASGLSVLIGGLVVLASPVSDMLVGVVLSIAAGVYTNIAACECLPRVSKISETKLDSLLTIVFFLIGVVPIGLALLNHSHCDGGEEHEDH